MVLDVGVPSLLSPRLPRPGRGARTTTLSSTEIEYYHPPEACFFYRVHHTEHGSTISKCLLETDKESVFGHICTHVDCFQYRDCQFYKKAVINGERNLSPMIDVAYRRKPNYRSMMRHYKHRYGDTYHTWRDINHLTEVGAIESKHTGPELYGGKFKFLTGRGGRVEEDDVISHMAIYSRRRKMHKDCVENTIKSLDIKGLHVEAMTSPRYGRYLILRVPGINAINILVMCAWNCRPVCKSDAPVRRAFDIRDELVEELWNESSAARAALYGMKVVEQKGSNRFTSADTFVPDDLPKKAYKKVSKVNIIIAAPMIDPKLLNLPFVHQIRMDKKDPEGDLVPATYTAGYSHPDGLAQLGYHYNNITNEGEYYEVIENNIRRFIFYIFKIMRGYGALCLRFGINPWRLHKVANWGSEKLQGWLVALYEGRPANDIYEDGGGSYIYYKNCKDDHLIRYSVKPPPES